MLNPAVSDHTKTQCQSLTPGRETEFKFKAVSQPNKVHVTCKVNVTVFEMGLATAVQTDKTFEEEHKMFFFFLVCSDVLGVIFSTLNIVFRKACMAGLFCVHMPLFKLLFQCGIVQQKPTAINQKSHTTICCSCFSTSGRSNTARLKPCAKSFQKK